MPDMVTVTCYGTKRTMERNAAIAFFSQGVDECDPGSSECSRYVSIVRQLRLGLTEVSD